MKRFQKRYGKIKIDIRLENSKNNSCPKVLPSFKAQIYASELDYIAKCIQDYPDIETGGQLFGAWTASGAPRVIYAIGPGPRANHESAFFNQDIEYLQTVGERLKEYGLQHIGEWHSHHKLGLSNPSDHDSQTMQNGITELNLDRLILCIGCINKRGIIINPFNYARDSHYVEAQWEIINTRNRLRETIDGELIGILLHPKSQNYEFGERYITPNKISVTSRSGWFSSALNQQDFKKIIDYLNKQTWIKEVAPKISEDGIVSIIVSTRTFSEIIKFPYDFPNQPFEIERLGFVEQSRESYDFSESWVQSPDLFEAFKINYNNHLKQHS